jgi:hypothetical protein
MKTAYKQAGGSSKAKITCKRGPDGVITQCVLGETEEQLRARLTTDNQKKSAVKVTVRE